MELYWFKKNLFGHGNMIVSWLIFMLKFVQVNELMNENNMFHIVNYKISCLKYL